eukprot:m.170176 g.170176  ORF g.170176 m.170176 type:complete len:177 (-) comp31604_c1_seq7:4806-5336(-)
MAAKRAVGVLRETYTMWERRAPLSPAHAAQLIKKNIPVFVQPSTRRCFADSEYEAAGATLSNDLHEADILIGVKQVKEPELQPKKTYMFFSHVIKGQQENMSLLNEILKQKVELIDYECLTTTGDRRAPRLIAFGEYAGRAGMIGTIRVGSPAFNQFNHSCWLCVGVHTRTICIPV